MTLKPAIALIALCLAACATPTVRDESPSSDLEALLQTAQRNLPDRSLPSGKQYCAEDAATEREQDECLGNLEALNLLRDKDRTRTLDQLERGVNRIKATRIDCRLLDFACKARRRALTRPP